MDDDNRCPECAREGEATKLEETDIALGDLSNTDPVYHCGPCGLLWQHPAPAAA